MYSHIEIKFRKDFALSLSMVRVASKPADWPRVSGSHDLPIGFSTKNCQYNSNAVGSKNEVLASLAT